MIYVNKSTEEVSIPRRSSFGYSNKPRLILKSKQFGEYDVTTTFNEMTDFFYNVGTDFSKLNYGEYEYKLVDGDNSISTGFIVVQKEEKEYIQREYNMSRNVYEYDRR